MSTHTRKQSARRPYPKERERPRTPFTPALWSRWLTEQPWAASPDRPTLRLREGIAEFRAHLADTHREITP